MAKTPATKTKKAKDEAPKASKAVKEKAPKAVKAVKVAKATKDPKVVKVAKAPKSKTPEENPQDLPAPSVEKQVIIAKFQVKEGDTGSPEVQVALLSKRIEKLVSHLKINPSDNHSRRGLLGIVSKRRRLLNYLEKKDELRYKDIVVKLGIGK